ncbi:MAG: AI-2E family transporter, partial [Planctomycetota bacterium]|nr:AI-2E family transporter [Planctomycetota bacterium]
MLQRLSPATRNAVLVLIGVCVLAFAWQVRAVLNPLILGYLCAYIVHPLVLRLEQRGWRRRTAVNLIFMAGGLLLTLAAGAVVLQGRTLVTDLSTREDLAQRIESRVEAFTERHGEVLEWVLPGTAEPETDVDANAEDGADSAKGGLADLLTNTWRTLSQEQQSEAGQAAGQAALRGAGGAWNVLRRIFGSLMALGVLLVLLPVYTYFLLFELEHIHRFVRTYLPARDRSRLSHVAA